MQESYVELQDIPVLRVRADMKGGGPAEAMNLLESKLPTLKGRKFYGIFRETPEGEEYYACVAKVDADDTVRMGLEAGIIDGGKFVRRRVQDWESVIRAGQLPSLFRELELAHAHEADTARYSIEFYRSQSELQLLFPVIQKT